MMLLSDAITIDHSKACVPNSETVLPNWSVTVALNVESQLLLLYSFAIIILLILITLFLPAL